MPPDSDTPKERGAYPVPEAAHWLGVSQAKLYRMLYRRELTAVKIGTRTVVPRAELERYLASRPVAQYSDAAL